MGSSSSSNNSEEQKQSSVYLPSKKKRKWQFIGNYILSMVSGGTINYDNGGFNYADPISRFRNIIQQGLQLNKSLKTGVWKGKQAIEMLTVKNTPNSRKGYYSETWFYSLFNVSLYHSAVLINGKVYSYEGQANQKPSVKIIQSKNYNYQWEYKGECERTESEIQAWIDSFNKSASTYNVLTQNCQDVADQIIAFATQQIINNYWKTNLFLNISTLGFIGYDNEGFNSSNPISRIRSNPQKQQKEDEQLKQNLETGVWKGKEVQMQNLYNHTTVLINGKIYSYEVKSNKKFKLIQANNSNYQWEYIGKCERTEQEITSWIDSFNNNDQPQTLFEHNCQDIADLLIQFAISL